MNIFHYVDMSILRVFQRFSDWFFVRYGKNCHWLSAVASGVSFTFIAVLGVIACISLVDETGPLERLYLLFVSIALLLGVPVAYIMTRGLFRHSFSGNVIKPTNQSGRVSTVIVLGVVTLIVSLGFALKPNTVMLFVATSVSIAMLAELCHVYFRSCEPTVVLS